MSKRHGIKAGYVPNRRNVTLDAVSGDTYWHDERIRASESYQFPVDAYAARLARRHRASCIVDIGCGTGRKLRTLHEAVPDARIIGIDQPPAIDFCRREYDFGDWVVADLESPGPPPAGVTADLIVCSDVIEHLLDPDALLAYITAMSNDETLTVLSTPEWDRLRGPDSLSPGNSQHIREWNRAELGAYLDQSGFEVVSHILQLPVRIAPDWIFLNQVAKRAVRCQPVRTNQACLLKRAAAG
ncbi:MAG: class I SAM-dependent methyltransferase [Candidatus Eiseniibacteriota bacterium]|jgi:2-polyprenyl-3-methyl-5-hydroxy-6-metoxy-1,4-benzoquinol methylase